MDRLRIVIVDDERLAREELRFLLAGHPDIEVIGEAESVRAALEMAALRRPDVIFMDVQLRGESGFDLLDRQVQAPCIVFVSDFDEYAIHELERQAFDYLLKPVNPVRLAPVLARLIAHRAPHRDPSAASRS